MPTTATPNVLVGPGFLFWAPLATADPTNTVAGSKFTDSWPVAWISLGATKEGSAFKASTKVEPIKVAEFFDPIQYATTERSGSLAFSLADWTMNNIKRVMNGGTLSVVSGTGATALNKYEPPAPGAEVRSMLGWESLDSTVRIIFRQCFQGGDVENKFAKAPDLTTLPAEFNFEVPSSGIPWSIFSAGTARVGV